VGSAKFWALYWNVLAEAGAEVPRCAAEKKHRIGGLVSLTVVSGLKGIPAKTIRDMAVRGRVPGAQKQGRRWMFGLAEIKAWDRESAVKHLPPLIDELLERVWPECACRRRWAEARRVNMKDVI
jgi:hypothetical protein